MNTEPEVSDGPNGGAPALRPFYWSVRRELWENRSIYLAPMIVAVVVLAGFMISTIGLAERRRALLLMDLTKQRAIVMQPYDAAAMMLIFTLFIVGIFYCLDALHGERRERSILFWKSLPVSDLTTVLSKVSVPLMLLPLIGFAVIVATQLLMLLWSSAVLLSSGLAATTWSRFNLVEQSVALLYGLIAVALWHAPIYAWLLLVSGTVRRAPFLWAVLPPIAIGFLEKIALNTTHFASISADRLTGWAAAAFPFKPHGGVVIESLAQLTPGRYLSEPSLWIGLAFAAVCMAGAVRLRRYRGPL